MFWSAILCNCRCLLCGAAVSGTFHQRKQLILLSSQDRSQEDVCLLKRWNEVLKTASSDDMFVCKRFSSRRICGSNQPGFVQKQDVPYFGFFAVTLEQALPEPVSWLLLRVVLSRLCVCLMKSCVCLCKRLLFSESVLVLYVTLLTHLCFEIFFKHYLFYSEFRLSVFLRVQGGLLFVWPDWRWQDHLQPVWGCHAGPGTKSHQRWCA